jgi:hypothetical protein
LGELWKGLRLIHFKTSSLCFISMLTLRFTRLQWRKNLWSFTNQHCNRFVNIWWHSFRHCFNSINWWKQSN